MTTALDILAHPMTKTQLALEALPFSLTCAADMENVTPPPIDWLVDGWIQRGVVTSLYGKGGSGKSTLALILQVCLATNTTFLGRQTQQACSIGFYGEEDGNEILRRQKRICDAYSIRESTLQDMHWVGLYGHDMMLCDVDKKTPEPSEFYLHIQSIIKHHHPDLVILDNIARLFSGNELDRRQVTRFVGVLEKLANTQHCAILILGHPAKAEESQYSGSTAWDGAVRCRLLLGSRGQEKEENQVTLKKDKTNYSEKDQIALEWRNGVLVPMGGNILGTMGTLEKRNQEKDDEKLFLMLLETLTKQGRNMSDKNGANYAPKIMMQSEHAKTKINKNRLEKAMLRLFDQKIILANQPVGLYGNRTRKHGIVLNPEVPP
jgi:RecA-family ATPase